MLRVKTALRLNFTLVIDQTAHLRPKPRDFPSTPDEPLLHSPSTGSLLRDQANVKTSEIPLKEPLAQVDSWKCSREETAAPRMLTTYELSVGSIVLTLQGTLWTKARSVIVALLLSLSYDNAHLGFRQLSSPLVWIGILGALAMCSSRVWSVSAQGSSRQIRLFGLIPLWKTWPELDAASFITGRIGYVNLNRAKPRAIGRKMYSLPLRVGKHADGFDSIDEAHDLFVGYGVLPAVEAVSTYQPPDAETVIKNRKRDRRNNFVVGFTFGAAALSFGAYKLVPVFEGKRKACLVLMRAYTLCT
jgi:hypothetical protein